MSGEISILMEDLEGRQNVIANVSAPDLFGEVFALAGVKSSVTAYTETGAEVLFLDVQRITEVCRESCAFHRQFGQRTTRDKVDAFLSAQQSREGRNPFVVPFNREQMADYLCVDRSALSLVLAQMKEEGLIEYHKNEFRLCHLE